MSKTTKRTTVICLCLFALAFVVRLIVWQNNKIAIDSVQYVVTEVYKQDARLLVSGDIEQFITGPNPPSDATIIMHPPGYPMFIAAIYALFGENEVLRIAQMLICSLGGVLIFLFTQRLFDDRTAVIAGLLTTVAPQFAYYSGIILPDELSALSVIAAMYFIARTWRDEKLLMMVGCGLGLAIACWLRANAFFLPVFVTAAIVFAFPKRWRFRPAAVIVAVFLLAIAPLTLRNYIVFDALIPVSVGFGTTFIEGLGEMDADGVTGMPTTDEGVMMMDAQHFGRPDYYGRLYAPDGIPRERNRVSTGVSLVLEDADWFAVSVLRRGLMTFRMERVPVIEPTHDERSTTPAWLHALNVPLKLVQRLFITAIFLPLMLLGAVILLSRKRNHGKLLILAAVPVYFFLVQPVVHTEYRYLLPATHVLIVLASVPIGWLFARITGSNRDGLSVAE
jgi:4-amino-4-deoxy-L-arabinose transferase-like glycosyltransferase